MNRLILGLALGTGVLAATSQVPIIDLGYAKYQGFYNETSNVTSYEGLRYAATTSGMRIITIRIQNLLIAVLGYNRWRAPQPPIPVEGVQQATVHPQQCPQYVSNGLTPILPSDPVSNIAVGKRDEGSDPEDCLTLKCVLPWNGREELV